jgi:hypothetical protein
MIRVGKHLADPPIDPDAGAEADQNCDKPTGSQQRMAYGERG